MAATDWNQVQLKGDPILVVGLRHDSAIEGFRVVVDKNVHPQLRRVADEALESIASMKSVPYTPYVEPAGDEYLSLDPAGLQVSTAAIGSPASQSQQTAQLLQIVQNADTLPTIGAGQLIERLAELYVQAICFHTNSPIIGFVTKTTARQVMKRSAIPLGKDDATDRLKTISRPELVLEGETHAVMAPTEIAVLNRPQFQFLVSDIGLVAQYVPHQVKLIDQRLKKHGIPLNAATSAAIQQKAIESIQLAKRLDAFLERLDQIDVSRVKSGKGFAAQDLKKADFVNAKGELECDPARVVELVDALEGRFFDDGFTTEKRRADRFRRRS